MITQFKIFENKSINIKKGDYVKSSYYFDLFHRETIPGTKKCR